MFVRSFVGSLCLPPACQSVVCLETSEDRPVPQRLWQSNEFLAWSQFLALGPTELKKETCLYDPDSSSPGLIPPPPQINYPGWKATLTFIKSPVITGQSWTWPPRDRKLRSWWSGGPERGREINWQFIVIWTFYLEQKTGWTHCPWWSLHCPP